jgi:hypothetical protein
LVARMELDDLLAELETGASPSLAPPSSSDASASLDDLLADLSFGEKKEKVETEIGVMQPPPENAHQESHAIQGETHRTYNPEFEMRQSVLGRRAQMAGEIGQMVAGGKLKRVDDSDAPPVDEHTFIQVKFNEPPPPRAPSPEPYVPPPVQVYTPAPTPAPVKVTTPPATSHNIGGTPGMLDSSDFQKMADELHIRVQTVEKRWKMGAQGFQQYAVMQIRWIVRYVNERFNINDPSVRTERTKDELVDWLMLHLRGRGM